MIGIDIVKVERMEKMIERFGAKALKRFLDDTERSLAASASTAAGFWAVKEAASKALGCGIGAAFGFHDIRIQKDENNAPFILLSKKIIERFEIESADVSITHDGGFAIAVVVLNTKRKKMIKSF